MSLVEVLFDLLDYLGPVEETMNPGSWKDDARQTRLLLPQQRNRRVV